MGASEAPRGRPAQALEASPQGLAPAWSCSHSKGFHSENRASTADTAESWRVCEGSLSWEPAAREQKAGEAPQQPPWAPAPATPWGLSERLWGPRVRCCAHRSCPSPRCPGSGWGAPGKQPGPDRKPHRERGLAAERPWDTRESAGSRLETRPRPFPTGRAAAGGPDPGGEVGGRLSLSSPRRQTQPGGRGCAPCRLCSSTRKTRGFAEGPS